MHGRKRGQRLYKGEAEDVTLRNDYAHGDTGKRMNYATDGDHSYDPNAPMKRKMRRKAPPLPRMRPTHY